MFPTHRIFLLLADRQVHLVFLESLFNQVGRILIRLVKRRTRAAYFKPDLVHGILDGYRVGDLEKGFDQRYQLAVRLCRRCRIAINKTVYYPVYLLADDVRRHAYNAVASQRQYRQRIIVIPAPDPEIIVCILDDSANLVQVAAGILDPDNIIYFTELDDGIRCQAGYRSRRHIIKYTGKGSGFGNCLEMPV